MVLLFSFVLKLKLLQDETLIRCKALYPKESWDTIASYIRNRTGADCKKRYKTVNPHLDKGPWAKEVNFMMHFIFTLKEYLWKNMLVQCIIFFIF